MIRVRVQLNYRLVPYEIEASDQNDITYVLGEGFLAKAIVAIQDFIDACFGETGKAETSGQLWAG